MKLHLDRKTFIQNKYFSTKTINKPKSKDLRIFIELLRWLAKCLTLSSNQETLRALKVADKILTVYASRGKSSAVLYCKDLRSKFQKFILNLRLSEEGGFKGSFDLPKSLKTVCKSIYNNQENYPFIRLIYSVLYITRFIRTEIKVDYKNITRPSYVHRHGLYRDFSVKNTYNFLVSLGVNPKSLNRHPKFLEFKEFHMSSKSGPNGHALWTSYIDAHLLEGTTLEAIATIGGDTIYKKILEFRQLYSIIPHFFGPLGLKPEKIRRLQHIQDKEGKTRTIAIADYYSQTVLLPLHNYLYKLLARIDQDCTLNQTKHFKSFKCLPGNKYYSVDLTAFTDLFPIEVNYLIINTLFGEDFAKAWKHLMVGIPFYDPHGGSYICYHSGNPMGLYSSWASTTLAHHFVLYLACQRIGRNWKNSRYMLLGDDIVIGDDALYKEYLYLLSVIGCEVNMSKTHISENGFEFAKQIRFRDRNISPFPLSALYERRRELITTLGIIQREIEYKDWEVSVLGSLQEYLIRIFRWPRPRARAFRPTLRMILALISYFNGKNVLGKALQLYVVNFAGKGLWKQLSPAHRRVFTHWIAVKVVQELYLKSRDKVITNTRKGKLGKLVADMNMEILLNSEGGTYTKLISSVPFFKVYQTSQIKFNNIHDELLDYGLGVQPERLRDYIGKVDIPMDDVGFYTRKRDVLIVRAMKSSRIIAALMKSTTEVVIHNGQLRIPIPWAHKCDPKYGKTLSTYGNNRTTSSP